MPKTRSATDPAAAARTVCDLCGLRLGAGRVDAAFSDRSYAFCCTGCRQVFTILMQAAGSAEPAAFRQTDLFRKCRDSGIIPRTEEDLPSRSDPAKLTARSQPHLESPPPAEALGLALKIDGMWCPACAWLVETAIREKPGVIAASCNFATDRLSVSYDPVRTSPEKLAAVIGNYGYRVHDPAGEQRGGDRQRMWIRFGVSAFLSMNVMMLSFSLYFGFFSELPADSVASISWPTAVLAAVVLGYGGFPLYTRAWQGLRRAAFSMETLVLVGALSAFGLSLVNLWAGSIHLYFDTACMLVTLVLLGKLLEHQAKQRVLEGLERFLSLMPLKVRIVSDAFPEGRFVHSRQLAAGDLFRVVADEIVAADGAVVSGSGAVEESALSGEPLPLAKKPGDPIRSGSRVHTGEFTVCAGSVGEQSTLGQMIAIVEKTLSGKTTVEGRTEKWLQWFVPMILSLAAVTGLVMIWRGAGLEESVLRAVTVTVIACPCALGVAIPLARATGVALAARQGMLVRNFSSFEATEHLDTVVLDKTGTVTRGEWRLLRVVPLGGIGENQALALASSLEQDAIHPMAFEIVREARDRLVRPEPLSAVYRAENGVTGLWRSVEVKIGSAEFVAGEFSGRGGVPGASPLSEAGNSRVYLAAGGKPAAVFVFGDELRDGIESAIDGLKRRGYRLALVSGDGAETTRAIGQRLGIAEAQGGQLPEDKAAFVAALQRRGRKVAMVGDGVNDAPALAQADVSLAVFAGGSLGKEVADATLMRTDPGQIPAFLDFAREVNRKIRQNLTLTFIYNGIGIPVAVSGLLSPLVAVCAMLLSSLSVIGNTLRMVRKHS
ncbi:MAG: cation-translocating P-type ATPase [Desulfobacterales bacterium]